MWRLILVALSISLIFVSSCSDDEGIQTGQHGDVGDGGCPGGKPDNMCDDSTTDNDVLDETTEVQNDSDLEVEVLEEPVESCPPEGFPATGETIECQNGNEQYVGDYCIIEWYIDPYWGCTADCSEYWGPSWYPTLGGSLPEYVQLYCRW